MGALERVGGSFQDTKDGVVQATDIGLVVDESFNDITRKVGGSFEDTTVRGSVPVRDLSEHLAEPVKCVLCGRMVTDVIRGAGAFVACAGDCGPVSAVV